MTYRRGKAGHAKRGKDAQRSALHFARERERERVRIVCL